MRDYLLVHVNGVAHRISGAQTFDTLSRFLRQDQRATGTKIVCEEGDCGACTVLIGRIEEGRLRYLPVNSCIQFLFQLDCAHVVTVEGLGNSRDLTPLQDAMVRCHGAQCGYCTPGFVMAMAGLLEVCERPKAQDVREAITGNLCRCTGYEPIVRAGVETKDQPRVDALYPPEPILDAIREVESRSVQLENFARPVTLSEALEVKAKRPESVIVQGATDYGVWRTKRGFSAPAVLSLDGVPGLRDIRLEDRLLTVGARATLAELERVIGDLVPSFAPILNRFGSPQIKNAGTLAGNIANASPIADSVPLLFVLEARLELSSTSGIRVVPIREFYLGYKKLDLAPGEIITRILIPLPEESDELRLYKVSKRSHLDISSFTAAVLMRRSGAAIASVRIAFGGVGPVVLRLAKTEAYLAGKPFALETFARAGELARDEVAPISDVRGSKDYRLQLAENILQRYFHESVGAPPSAASAQPVPAGVL
jgi:xanthine dehydrogenase small subunit